jgi:threonine/homoserine/homoserine lactone efflux protein
MLGFVSSIPSGPVGVNVISTTLKTSRRYAIAIGIGAALIDILYVFLGFTGISFITIPETTLYWFQIVGIIVLVLLGIKEINYKAVNINALTEVRPKRRRYFALGIVLSLTNPMIFFSYAALATIVRSFDVFDATTLNDFIFALSMGIGAIGWFIVLSVITHGFKEKVNGSLLKRISVISGYLLILCATYLCFNLALELI